jgi:hypothetical protein
LTNSNSSTGTRNKHVCSRCMCAETAGSLVARSHYKQGRVGWEGWDGLNGSCTPLSICREQDWPWLQQTRWIISKAWLISILMHMQRRRQYSYVTVPTVWMEVQRLGERKPWPISQSQPLECPLWQNSKLRQVFPAVSPAVACGIFSRRPAQQRRQWWSRDLAVGEIVCSWGHVGTYPS